MAESLMPSMVAEFTGTFLLVFTIGCNVMSQTAIWAPVSIACVLMVAIYAFGGISGANFNPAVSVTLGLTKAMGGEGMDWGKVGAYCGIQLAGGLVAGACYLGMFGAAFNLAPAKGFGQFNAGLCELLYTFMLCFVVLNVAVAKNVTPNEYYGLAIGFVIIAGAYGAGAVSGGCFNPAVALGIDLSSAGLGFGWGFAYMGYEILGAALAAGLFRVVRPDEFGGESEYGLGTKLCSEFIGTYFLVLTVGLNVLGKSAGPVWSIAASLMSMIYALGNCSGAHFNPAVTLAILASGRDLISAGEAAAYMGIQILGGISASFTYAAMHHGATFALAPGKGFGFGHAAMAEITFTFVLCFVVLSVATVREPSKDMFGLAIASCVTAGGYAIGAVSGGSLNPAVSFGISTSNIINHGHFYNCLIYSLYEFVGAGIAAGVFMVTHPSEYKKGLMC